MLFKKADITGKKKIFNLPNKCINTFIDNITEHFMKTEDDILDVIVYEIQSIQEKYDVTDKIAVHYIMWICQQLNISIVEFDFDHEGFYVFENSRSRRDDRRFLNYHYF